eukprot:2887797-Prymnesium_polylepis.1
MAAAHRPPHAWPGKSEGAERAAWQERHQRAGHQCVRRPATAAAVSAAGRQARRARRTERLPRPCANEP